MKLLAAYLGAMAGAVLLTAQTTPAKKPAEKEEPPIPGIVLQRPNGNQLGLTLDNGVFKLSFYDKKRKPIDVDVTRALARWHPVAMAVPVQTMLNLTSDGKALDDGLFVHPPYAFKLFLTLLKGEGPDEKVVETYVVDVTDAIQAKH